MRKMRTRKPPRRAGLPRHEGKASGGDIDVALAGAADASSTARALGPATANLAHCSVTGVMSTFRSGHSVCSHSSSQAAIPVGAAGGGMHQEMIIGETGGDAVIDDEAGSLSMRP